MHFITNYQLVYAPNTTHSRIYTDTLNALRAKLAPVKDDANRTKQIR